MPYKLTEQELEARQNELNKLVFEKSLSLRNFEIDNFWKRGWFFGALLLAIATAYLNIPKSAEQYQIYIAFLGLLVSVGQALMNRGSKYWQERWETKTKRQETILGIDVTKSQQFGKKEKYYLDAGIRAKNENGLVVARRFSVSKLTILIWDLIAIAWLLVWFENWHLSFDSQICWKAIFIHGGVILYIFFFFFGKTRNTTLENGRKNIRNIFDLITFGEGGGGKVYQRLINEITELDSPEIRVSKKHTFDSDQYIQNKI